MYEAVVTVYNEYYWKLLLQLPQMHWNLHEKAELPAVCLLTTELFYCNSTMEMLKVAL